MQQVSPPVGPVLVVDDDPHIRQLVSVVLRRAGIEAETVSDGAAALECIRSRDYSVVLLDLMMPHVDGFQVIDQLAALGEDDSRPMVLVMSANLEGALGRMNDRVVSGFVQKPFDITFLASVVRKAIERLVNGSGGGRILPFPA